VIGYDDWAGDIRTFKLERLENAQVLDEPYTIPEDFDPEIHLAGSWGIMTGPEASEVVLRFTPAAHPYVLERRWHPTQKVEPLPGGGCILRLQVSEPMEMQP
jgi:predicted DNA-binding transcriptional regulator YafY